MCLKYTNLAIRENTAVTPFIYGHCCNRNRDIDTVYSIGLLVHRYGGLIMSVWAAGLGIWGCLHYQWASSSTRTVPAAPVPLTAPDRSVIALLTFLKWVWNSDVHADIHLPRTTLLPKLFFYVFLCFFFCLRVHAWLSNSLLVCVYLPQVRWVFLLLTMVTFIDSAHWLPPCFYCVIGLHCDKVASAGALCLDHQASPVSEQRDCQFLSEVCAPCPKICSLWSMCPRELIHEWELLSWQIKFFLLPLPVLSSCKPRRRLTP